MSWIIYQVYTAGVAGGWDNQALGQVLERRPRNRLSDRLITGGLFREPISAYDRIF